MLLPEVSAMRARKGTFIFLILSGLVSTSLFAGEIRKMVVGRYDCDGTEPGAAAGGAVRVVPVVTVENPEMFRSLLRDLKRSQTAGLTWYMYHSVPVCFLDGNDEIVIGLEYWPVTKPRGGFRPLLLKREGGCLVAVLKGPPDCGWLLPQLADLIDVCAPKGTVWPLGED